MSQKKPTKNTKESDGISKLRNILVGQNYVDSQSFNKIKESANSASEILDELVSEEMLSFDIFGQAVSEYAGVEYADIEHRDLPQNYTERIPYKIANEYHAILFEETEDKVVVATDLVSKKGIYEALREVFKEKQIELAYALPDGIERALDKYESPLDIRFSEMLEDESLKASELLNEIFSDAINNKASDIHLEPVTDGVKVRFRLDGVLKEVGQMPKSMYDKVVNRIKVKARLRIDSHNQMQDGAMQHESEEATVDTRISIVPTMEGEKVAIRILAEYLKGFSLKALGLTKEQEETLRKASKNPFGMILVAGPTGSGKTTTLYALLRLLDQNTSNITTIEDPVEYRIDGVNQIQVNEETDITFAEGLRSIVRQDPDVILIGEIRDNETSEIALNSALTGHLVFSTFHANNAATSIPRLIDMGAEPFLVSSTLEVMVAQRLVRKLCTSCRYSNEKTTSEIKKQSAAAAKKLFEGDKKKVRVYESKGCDLCGHTGYRGRTGVFEIIKVSDEMRKLIMDRPSSDDIASLAKKQGSETMFTHGLQKVREGETTLEELLRVVGED